MELYSMLLQRVVEDLAIEDLGDVVLAPGDMEESIKRIEKVFEHLLETYALVHAVGGEHTLSLPIAKVFASRSWKPCMVVLDAHLDLRNEYLGVETCHATVLRRIVESANLHRVVFVGTRAVCREEVEHAKQLGLEVVWARDVFEDLDGALRRIRKAVEPCGSIYVSIDLDVMDPAYAPGVQTPEPLGLSPWQVLRILDNVIDERLWIVDYVELCPVNDPSEATSALVAKLIVEISAVWMERMGARW